MLDTRKMIVKAADSKDDLEKIITLRKKVFVEETGLDRYSWDGLDDCSTHFLVLYKGKAVCCMRLLPINIFSLQNVIPLPPEITNFREISRLAVDPEFRNSNVLLKMFVGALRHCIKEKIDIDYVLAVPLKNMWGNFGGFKDIVHPLSSDDLKIKSASGKPIEVLPLYIKIEDVSKIIIS